MTTQPGQPTEATQALIWQQFNSFSGHVAGNGSAIDVLVEMLTLNPVVKSIVVYENNGKQDARKLRSLNYTELKAMRARAAAEVTE